MRWLRHCARQVHRNGDHERLHGAEDARTCLRASFQALRHPVVPIRLRLPLLHLKPELLAIPAEISVDNGSHAARIEHDAEAEVIIPVLRVAQHEHVARGVAQRVPDAQLIDGKIDGNAVRRRDLLYTPAQSVQRHVGVRARTLMVFDDPVLQFLVLEHSFSFSFMLS